ncbi:HK97 family phage prohead protease [Ciceribacter sp. L1K22]|uniref:HK97 family phage prohead protease n=1 Tax=Ciceribacter sp. L1K22 TaxID=2820275 RepID=UPI001ABE2101|nr:HK97 family phage prohead protease [Ciceribacter sp. L1K22]MBO3760029.1 HK97 family phage prohead protease [Ciceribacter sp. L1K22]
MRDYETRASEPVHYSVGGYITSVGGRLTTSPSTEEKGLSDPTENALQGYACRFNRAHEYKGRIEVFVKGCFDKSLASRQKIGFWIDHKASAEVATTNDNLELLTDSDGLAFRLVRPPASVVNGVKQRHAVGMSVGYLVVRQEQKTVDGVPVTFIHEADLREISLVKHGAVREAFVDLVDPKICSLKTASEMKRILWDGAAIRFEQAIMQLT